MAQLRRKFDLLLTSAGGHLNALGNQVVAESALAAWGFA